MQWLQTHLDYCVRPLLDEPWVLDVDGRDLHLVLGAANGKPMRFHVTIDGMPVTGSVRLASEPVIAIPASALTELNRQPAVWIVDPKNLTVSMRKVELLRHDPGTVVIAQGLDTGDIVVTAGIQALHPGQKVRLLGSPS